MGAGAPDLEAAMSLLLVVLPVSRDSCGRLGLIGGDGKTLFGPVRALGTADERVAKMHANPMRDPILPYGHPPTGDFDVIGSLPPGFLHPRRPRRFGRSGALVLAPRGGQAIDALGNGRKFYYLHGGPADRRGRLRPTYGGIRVEERAMAALLEAVNRAFLEGDGVRSVQIVDMPRPERVRPADRVGAARPHLGTRAGTMPVTRALRPHHAALLAVGAKLLEREPRDRTPAPSRRRFLASVALLLAAVEEASCGGDEAPSPCRPLACDPVDSWCPPDGVVCESDVAVGAPGDYVVVGPDPWDIAWPAGGPPPSDTGGDTSGGSG